MNNLTFPARYARTLLVLGMLLLLGLAARAQRTAPATSPRNYEATTTYATQKNLTVAVTKYPEARKALATFIRQRATRIQRQEETPEQFTAEFALPTRDLVKLDSLSATLGYVLENNLNTNDLNNRIGSLRDDEQQAIGKLAAEEQRLKYANQSKEELENARRDIGRATDRLAELRQKLATLEERTGQAYVLLRLYDEVSFPTGNRRVTFVNMPGVEFGYLRLDNPKVGLTSPAYQGYALKYLVTRGKSYINLGVYKPTVANSTEADFINELFVINFGQDFYPRNFGRGRRKYLNLYTNYQLGGFIVNRNSDKGSEFIPNLNLGLGVELLKTRHILFDVKASYFVPLNDRSRDLRGVLGQAAFNFIF